MFLPWVRATPRRECHQRSGADPLDVDGGAVNLVYPVGVLLSQKPDGVMDVGGYGVFPLIHFQGVDVAAFEVEEFREVALAHAEHSPDQA